MKNKIFGFALTSIVMTLVMVFVLKNTGSATAEMNIPASLKGSLVGYWSLDSFPLIDSVNNLKGTSYSYFPGTVDLAEGVSGKGSYFSGNDGVQFQDIDKYSIGKDGMTVSMWVKPETFNFQGEADGYVHFLGKQEWNSAPNYEWVFRLYNENAWDSVSRSKRISFYVFNLSGGLGVGSYFQDDLKENEWVHVVGVANGTHTLIYKNGILRDKDAYAPGLNGFVDIVPGNGNAPLRIGCADRHSSFKGSLDEVMVYDRALSSSEIKSLYDSYQKNTSVPSQNTTPPIINTTIPSTNNSAQTDTSKFQSNPIDFYPNGQFIKAFRITSDESNIIFQGLGTEIVQINDLLRIAPRSSSPVCDVSRAGTIYFNSNTKKHYGCDGNIWNAMY